MRGGRLRAAWLAGGLLALTYLLAIGADVVAPYHYATQHREFPYERPTKLRFVDHEGRFHLRPFVYAPALDDKAAADGTTDPGRRVPLRVFVPGSPRRFAGSMVINFRLFAVEEPAHIFLLGTDEVGRDVFSRLVYGARISLFAGLLAAGLAVTVGWALGTVAGFYGGRTDEAIMRLTELFLALPWLYLLFGVRAILPLDLDPVSAFLVFIMIVGGIGWARPARIFRGVAMGVREREFVQAARGFGATNPHLMRYHVLPQSLGVFWTQFALLVPRFILAEVTLSFLGLGVAEPMPSWGNMLTAAKAYPVLISYGWMLAPALALLAVVLCLQVLADAVQARSGATQPAG